MSSKLFRSIELLLALSLAPVLFVSTAQAVSLGFGCISNNLAGDCAIGEAQISVEVTDLGGGQVQFDFMNSGPNASSITDVYFDDGTLLGISSLIDADDGVGGDPGVDFSGGSAAPPNLPAGSMASPPFVATTGFLADSDPPPASMGVNPGEWLGVIFNLQGGGSFADILAELTSGELRIGVHLQALASGGSESFVNVPIPEPGTVLLMGLGLAVLARRRI